MFEEIGSVEWHRRSLGLNAIDVFVASLQDDNGKTQAVYLDELHQRIIDNCLRTFKNVLNKTLITV